MLFIGFMKTKKLLPLFAASLMLFPAIMPIHAGGIRIGDTPARRIAKDASIPGKHVAGQCLPFANALHTKFQAAGISSEVVSFQYDAPRELSGGGFTGAHAVVIYQDDGRIYVMDNQSCQPKWIHEASTIDMARQFAGKDLVVGAARVLENAHPVAAQGRQAASTAPTLRASVVRTQLACQ